MSGLQNGTSPKRSWIVILRSFLALSNGVTFGKTLIWCQPWLTSELLGAFILEAGDACFQHISNWRLEMMRTHLLG